MKNMILQNLNISYYVDTAEGQEGICSAMHFHNLYELYFLDWGKREYLIDGVSYPVDENKVILVMPGTFHETTGGEYRRKLIHFNADFLAAFFSKRYIEELLSVFHTKLITLSSEEKDELCWLAQRAERFYNEKNIEGAALNVANILSLLGNANKRQTETVSEETLIDRITEYIEKNAFGNIELEQIAKTFYISKYYLCHLFRTEKRMSFVDFLTKIRIERASYLLVTTKKKIKEISIECGFNSEYYFSKRFHSLTGLSPREYRQHCVEKLLATTK